MSYTDHEHPCPSVGCRDYLRRQGYDVPDDMDCCVCFFRSGNEVECFVCHRVATVLPTSPNESRWSLCPDCGRP